MRAPGVHHACTASTGLWLTEIKLTRRAVGLARLEILTD